MKSLKQELFMIMLLSTLSITHLSHAETVELGRINIELFGEVTVSTCGVLQSEQNKYIDLGSYSSKNLSRVGHKTPAVPIAFHLSNCLPGSPITLTFHGNKDPVDRELLALDHVENHAQNLAIEILDHNKQRFPLDVKSQDLIADQAGNIAATFYAHYIVTRDFATAGVANASAQFIIQYE